MDSFYLLKPLIPNSRQMSTEREGIDSRKSHHSVFRNGKVMEDITRGHGHGSPTAVCPQELLACESHQVMRTVLMGGWEDSLTGGMV